MARVLDALLLVAGAGIAGALAIVAPLVVAFVVATFAIAARAMSRTAVVLACIVAAACALRVRARFAAESAAELRTRAFGAPQRCSLEGVLDSMPRVRGVLTAELVLASIDCEGAPQALAGLRVRLYDLPDGVARGDRLAVVAQLARARRNANPDLGDPRPQWARRGHDLSGSALDVVVLARGRGAVSFIDRTRARLRRGLLRAMPASAAPIARALVLGEEDLAPDDDEAFRRSGLTHLLAVSGSHVALVVGGLVEAVRRLLLRSVRLARRCEPARVAAAIGVPLAIVYEQLAGDSGSARRATAMAVVVLLVRAMGRRPDTARTLGASILAALVIDPLAPYDLSFALSLAATLGLVGLGPPLRTLLGRVRAMPRTVSVALATTLAASIACAPLVAGIAGSVPIAGLAANVVAVPVGELAALPICNVAAVIGALAESVSALAGLARLTGFAAAGSIAILRRIALVASTPSWAMASLPPPTAWQLGVLFACALVVYLRRRAWLVAGPLACAALVLLELARIRSGAPRGVLRVTVLDVGQGDSTLLDFPDGRAMLIDGGGEVGSPWDPGRIVVAPVLAARRRSALDVAVLSHPHPDHFIGLRHVLATRRVRALWDTGQGEGSGLADWYRAVRTNGTTVERPASLCGARDFGGARVEVLHPCPTFDRDRGANDNSLVLRITYGAHHVLLVGDAEHEAERALLEARVDLRADLLKVGHHGSRTSSSDAFLAAVRPSIATISCGVRNRFGHPHDVALERLARAGARVLRTDLEGAIRFTTDGRTFTVETAREGW